MRASTTNAASLVAMTGLKSNSEISGCSTSNFPTDIKSDSTTPALSLRPRKPAAEKNAAAARARRVLGALHG